MLDPTGHLDRSPNRLRLTLAVLGSLTLHSLVVFGVVPELIPRPDTERLLELECPALCPLDREEPEPVSYRLMVLPPLEPEPALVAPTAEQEPLPEEQQPEEEPTPPEPLPETYYMVDLQTREDEEPPVEETPYLAPVNMRTDEEVQAERTTLREVERGDVDPQGDPTDEPTPEEEALDEVDDTEVLDDLPVEALAFAEDLDEGGTEADAALGVSEQVAGLDHRAPAPDPNRPRSGDGPALDLSAFNPSLQGYQRSPLARDDRRNRERIASQMHYQGYLHHDDEAEWERMRASLENMVPEVRTGTETRLNARRHEYAEYISYVHRRIHALWANDYLMSLDLRFDPTDPLSNPDLQTTLELVIDATGEIVRVNIVRTSGFTMYDGEAIAIVHRIGPLRPPPSAMMSANGNAYIHWNFWRDQRQCGTFGASVHRVR